MAMSRFHRRLLIALGCLAALVLVLIAGAYGALQTSWARARVAAVIADVLSGEEMTVTIGTLDGPLPGTLVLHDVTASDGDGQWAEIGEMKIVWRPWRFLFKSIDVQSVVVTDATLERLPKRVERDTQVSSRASSFSLPNIGIEISAISIDMALGPALTNGKVEPLLARGSARYGMGNGIHLSLDATQGEADGSRLAARVHVNPEDETLELTLHAHEAVGGLVSRLIGAANQEPFDIDVTGDGSLMNWSGTAKATFGSNGRLDATIKTSGDQIPQFAVTGTVVTAPPLSGRLERAAAPPYGFDINFSVDDDSVVAFTRTSVKTAGATMTADGKVDLSDGSLDLTVDIQPSDAETRNALLDPASAPELALSAHLRGFLSGPYVEISASAPSLSGTRFAAERTTAMAELDFDTGDPETLFTFDASATVAKLAIVDSSGYTAPPSDLLVRTKGAYHGRIQRISFGDLLLRSDWASVNFAGGVNLNGDAAAMMNGRLTAELRGFPGAGPALVRFLKEPARLESSIVYMPEGERLRLAKLSIAHPRISANGDVEIGFDPQTVHGNLKARIEDTEALAELFGIDVTGGPVDLELATAPSGTIANSTLTASSPELAISGTRLKTIKAALTLRDVETQTGTLDIGFTAPTGPVRASTKLVRSQNPDRFALNDLRLTAAGGELDGNLVIPLGGGAATGDLSGQFASLDAVSTLIGTDLHGAATFSVAFSDIGGQQGITGHLEADNLSTRLKSGADVRIAHVVAATGGDVAKLARGVPFSFDVAGVSVGEVRLDTASISGNTNFRSADYRVTAKGTYRGDVSLTAAGSADWDKPAKTFQLDSLDGMHGDAAIRLAKPASLIVSEGGLEVMPTTIQIGDGRLDLEWNQGQGRLHGQAALADLPLGIVHSFVAQSPVAGMISGTADIDVGPDKRAGRARFRFADLTIASGGNAAEHLNGTLDADWRNDGLTLNGQLSGQGDAEIKMKAAMPLHYTDAGAFDVPADGRLTGDIAWNADVGPFWNALGPDTQTLQGRADAALKLGGTVSMPVVTGDITLHNGRFVDFEMGTVLDKVALSLTANRREVRLVEASATDGGTGKISATGRIRLDPTANFPIDLEVNADKAKLVRRTDVTVVASGKLSFTKEGDSSVLEGSIRTDDVEAILVDLSSPDVMKLQVTEIGPDGSVIVARDRQDQAASPKATKLNVDVKVPGHAFIRGRGLDSEWRGEIKATGTVLDPQLVGTFNVVRGNFKFAGRTFELQRGQIAFRSGDKIDPDLNLQAVYEVQDLSATVNVTGPSSAPKVALSSTPALPQDEILSRILFGSSVAELTPLQAVQLADAVRGLGKPGGGLLGSARSAVGLDVLQVGSAQSGGGLQSTTITGGKYIGKNIYLEVESAADGSQEKVGVDVGVTKNLSVQSDVSPEQGNRIGLKWKKDY
jgi:translocation and assembly module TamB